MNYELAKQLKDAGFPQHSVSIEGDFYENGEDVSSPSLSELIEACGDRFYSLVYAMENDWRCFSEREVDFTTTSHGKSTEEAVARLWLQLNKK